MKINTQPINNRNMTRINTRRQEIIKNLNKTDMLTSFSLQDLANYFYTETDVISEDINKLSSNTKENIFLPVSGDEVLLKIITDKRYSAYKEHVENGGDVSTFLFANGISKEPLPYGKSYDVIDKNMNISIEEYTDVYNVNPKRTSFLSAIKSVYNNVNILEKVNIEKHSSLYKYFENSSGNLERIKEKLSNGYTPTLLATEFNYSEKGMNYIIKMLEKYHNIVPSKENQITNQQKARIIELIQLGKTNGYISSVTGLPNNILLNLLENEIYPEHPDLKSSAYYRNINRATEILSYLEQGYSQGQVANKMDVTRGTVINILNDYVFAHPLEKDYVQKLRDQGRYMTKIEITNEEFDMCIDLRLEKPELSVDKIAKLVGITEPQANLALQKAGLDVASTGYIQRFQDNEQNLIIIKALKELGYSSDKIATLMEKTSEWVDKKYKEAVANENEEDVHGYKSYKLYTTVTSNENNKNIADKLNIPVSSVASYKTEYRRNIKAGVLTPNKGNIKQDTYDITHKYEKEIFNKQRSIRTTKENKPIFGLRNQQTENEENYTREE